MRHEDEKTAEGLHTAVCFAPSSQSPADPATPALFSLCLPDAKYSNAGSAPSARLQSSVSPSSPSGTLFQTLAQWSWVGSAA